MVNYRVRCTLMALSAGAGVIHIAIIGPHFEESLWFGVFFLVVAAFQLVWAGMVLGLSDRWVLLLGSAFNLGVVLVWLLSRTTGVPIGPDAGNPEPVALADAVATGFEVMVVCGAVVLFGWHSRVRELSIAVPWGVGLLALWLTAVAVFGGFGAAPAFAHHDEGGHGVPVEEDATDHAPGPHESEVAEP